MQLLILAWLFDARTGRLVSTFILFIVVQVMFAALYFLLYRRRRDNFAFNADILRSQSATARSSSERALADLRGAIETLREVMKELDRGVKPVVNGKRDASLELPSGRKCVMVFMSGPPAGGPSGSRLNIIDSNGQMLLDADPAEMSFRGWLHSAAWLETSAEWGTVMPRMLKVLESKQQGEVRRLES